VLLAYLGPEDLNRYHAFSRPLRKQQFLLGRMLLRVALSTELGIPADDIRLIGLQASSPRLILPDTVKATPGFCVAHSGNYVSCALDMEGAIGLDVEIMNPGRDFMAISRLAFSPDEYALLYATPEAERKKMFYQIWTKKEALYKLNVFEQRELFPGAFYQICTQKEGHFRFFSFPQENLMVTLCCRQ